MAQLEIKFVNVEKSQALEEYAKEHVQNLMRRLDRRPGESKYIDIQFRSESKDPEGTLRSAEVMICYRYPDIKPAFHIKKHGTDLRSTLDEAVEALENSIQRATAKRAGARKHLGKPSQVRFYDDHEQESA